MIIKATDLPYKESIRYSEKKSKKYQNLSKFWIWWSLNILTNIQT